MSTGAGNSNEGGQAAKLRAEISYGDLKAVFSGDVEEVLHSINSFIAKQLPAYDVARTLSLNYSVKELIEKFQEYIKITPEGPRVWSQEKKLSDKELVGLQLVGQRISYDSGRTSSDSATLNELQESTALNPKSLSSRLSELNKAGHVSREPKESGAAFKITTQGIFWLSQALSKK